MKISVQAGSRQSHQQIIELLEAYEPVKYSYLGPDRMNPISVNFETDAEEKVAIGTATKLIKAKFGRSLSFRVVPMGSVVYY